jgi:hypothetical protein
LPYQEVSYKFWRTISLKTLDSLQFSDRTALNIKLKTPILLQVKLGLEVVSPLLWDANITDFL